MKYVFSNMIFVVSKLELSIDGNVLINDYLCRYHFDIANTYIVLVLEIA